MMYPASSRDPLKQSSEDDKSNRIEKNFPFSFPALLVDCELYFRFASCNGELGVNVSGNPNKML